jgi:hypothetical protein
MTLVVHIGTHKTGTTAIQKFATAHRDELRAQGLWYPSYAGIDIPEHYGHHHFAHAVAGEKHGTFTPEDAPRFMESVHAGQMPGETVLLSAEPIYRHTLGKTGDYWSRRRAYIRRLKETIGTDDVTILVVLRRQDDFARSLYQENVKVNKYAADFRSFLAQASNQFDYHRQLRAFAAEFQRVSVLVYEDLKKTGLVETFFRKLGIEAPMAVEAVGTNPSLPVELVEYKRLLNATNLGAGKLKQVGNKLVRYAERRSVGERGKVDWLPASEMAAFVTSYDESNERLRRAFASDHPAPLFPPAEEGTPAYQYAGMTLERFAQLTSEIFLSAPPRRRAGD